MATAETTEAIVTARIAIIVATEVTDMKETGQETMIQTTGHQIWETKLNRTDKGPSGGFYIFA
jgi:hypothetical protein